MTRVLVFGGRAYQDKDRVFEELDIVDDAFPISLVIHGACMKQGSTQIQGADRWAEEWAKARERPYIGFPAKWTQHGRPGGPMRNDEMIRRMKPEYALGFPGGTGSADMARKAKTAGIETRLIGENEKEARSAAAVPSP